MAPKTRIKTKAVAVNVPQSREMAAQAVAEIGVASREIKRLEADMNDEMALIKEAYEKRVEPFRNEIEAASKGLQIYAEANRGALTNDYKVKTVMFTTGSVLWRMNPPSVRLTDTEENVIATCEAMGLEDFIRRSPTLNRDAIKAKPEEAARVPGLKIGQNEVFVVEPFETELAEV